jgi:hypothetical protein
MIGRLTRTIHVVTGEENGDAVCGYIEANNISSIIIVSGATQQDTFVENVVRSMGLEIHETVPFSNLQDWLDTNERHIQKSVSFVTFNVVMNNTGAILIYRHRADDVFFRFLEAVLYGLSLTKDTISRMIDAVKNGRAL